MPTSGGLGSSNSDDWKVAGLVPRLIFGSFRLFLFLPSMGRVLLQPGTPLYAIASIGASPALLRYYDLDFISKLTKGVRPMRILLCFYFVAHVYKR